jgi:hypothetical protein
VKQPFRQHVPDPGETSGTGKKPFYPAKKKRGDI